MNLLKELTVDFKSQGKPQYLSNDRFIFKYIKFSIKSNIRN